MKNIQQTRNPKQVHSGLVSIVAKRGSKQAQNKPVVLLPRLPWTRGLLVKGSGGGSGGDSRSHGSSRSRSGGFSGCGESNLTKSSAKTKEKQRKEGGRKKVEQLVKGQRHKTAREEHPGDNKETDRNEKEVTQDAGVQTFMVVQFQFEI